MRYKVILEVTDKMPFHINVEGANGEEKAPNCKVSLWTSKWPKDDKCDLGVPCPRCIAVRAVEADVIPIRDGCEIKIDKIKSVVTKDWATGEGGPKDAD